MPVGETVRTWIHEALLWSPRLGRHFAPFYPFNFSAAQLVFLCETLEETTDVPGIVVEVGCSAGWTTLFLKKFMDAQGIDKEYVAIDTFSGFVPEDINYEVSMRGKREEWFSGFAANKKKWFDKSMEMNGLQRVRSIQADINNFDFATLGPISFCLLDVDLYRPMKKSLPQLYEALSKGGAMIVDDCNPEDVLFNGADQAFNEFLQDISEPRQVVHGKLGILRAD